VTISTKLAASDYLIIDVNWTSRWRSHALTFTRQKPQEKPIFFKHIFLIKKKSH